MSKSVDTESGQIPVFMGPTGPGRMGETPQSHYHEENGEITSKNIFAFAQHTPPVTYLQMKVNSSKLS